MGILDFAKGQLIDVIRWEDPETYLLVKKWDRHWDEIKNDATLIVDPGQAAIVVHNGKIEAIEKEGGRWNLETENRPFLTAFKNIMRGLESQDKAAVYFLKLVEVLNQKWGTKNPVKYVDPVYNFPIKLRAFGNFSFKIGDIENFWQKYIGTRAEVTVDEIRDVIVDRLLQQITDIFAEANFGYAEIDKNRVELAEKIGENINEHIKELGLEITDFKIEDTNFDEETEKLIMKVSEQSANAMAMNQMGNIDGKAMDNYARQKQLDALEAAAGNEGTMGGMMGTFVGMNMGQQMGNQIGKQMAGAGQNTSQPIQDSPEVKLERIKGLLDKGLISQEDYEQKKKEILAEL